MEHWKGMSATMVGRQEKFLNSRRSRMAKIVTFWPWWQPFDSFCFETLSFFSFFPYFLFATKKKVGEGGGGTMSLPLVPPVSPALYSETCQTSEMDLFPKINNDSKSFPIFAKSFILDVWEGFEYASGKKTYLAGDQPETFTKRILLQRYITGPCSSWLLYNLSCPNPPFTLTR